MTTKDYQTRRPLRIFLSYFRPHRGLFLLDISCAFLIAVIDLAFPLISRTAMYHWLPDKQFSIFFTVMALVVAAFVLRAGLYFIVGYWGHTFGIRVEADIRRDLYRHIQYLPFAWHKNNPTGDIIQRCTSDVERIKTFFEEQFVSVFRAVAMIVFALVCMALMNWKLALVPAVMFPIIIVYSLLFHNSSVSATLPATNPRACCLPSRRRI